MMRSRAIALTAVLLSSPVVFAQDGHSQAALQAEKSNAQKLLMDSIEKLDVAGVRTALDKGANPNCASSTESPVSTAVIHGVDSEDYSPERAEQKAVEILQTLFKTGARYASCDGTTVLYLPISEGRALLTGVLLNNGASPTTKIEGETPMDIAVEYGEANIVELLKKYGVPDLEPKEAVQRRLIHAAGFHQIPNMEDAIDAGADVNGRNRQGETALVEACGGIFMGHEEDYAAVLYLLKKGADPTVQSSEDADCPSCKTTALHQIISATAFVLDKKNQDNERLKDGRVRAVSVIKALLQDGALVSARDYYGQTPLHVAARRNNVVGAKMLIEAGCKIMPLDQRGKTPLDYAESAEMIKLLKDHGAKEQ